MMEFIWFLGPFFTERTFSKNNKESSPAQT